jgi:hypothetical protein
MQIKQKLQLINNEASNVIEITENYKMGFITVSELMGQLMIVAMNVEVIKNEIKDEYNINDDDVISLMLQM